MTFIIPNIDNLDFWQKVLYEIENNFFTFTAFFGGLVGFYGISIFCWLFNTKSFLYIYIVHTGILIIHIYALYVNSLQEILFLNQLEWIHLRTSTVKVYTPSNRPKHCQITPIPFNSSQLLAHNKVVSSIAQTNSSTQLNSFKYSHLTSIICLYTNKCSVLFDIYRVTPPHKKTNPELFYYFYKNIWGLFFLGHPVDRILTNSTF